LWERYGHHRSLYGWYLTHEMNDLGRASAYYDPVAAYCRSLSPDMPVMCAPAGTPIIDKEALRRSKVDIFAYQDSAGAGYVPYRYTYDPENRIRMLDQVFGSYRKLHEGTEKHLWADLEIWEMDGSAGYAKAYPPPFSRVKRQIETEAKYVEMLTAYEVLGFLEPPRSGWRLKDRRAAALYRDYAAYLERRSRSADRHRRHDLREDRFELERRLGHLRRDRLIDPERYCVSATRKGTVARPSPSAASTPGGHDVPYSPDPHRRCPVLSRSSSALAWLLSCTLVFDPVTPSRRRRGVLRACR
jgi:hypothetical protein